MLSLILIFVDISIKICYNICTFGNDRGFISKCGGFMVKYMNVIVVGALLLFGVLFDSFSVENQKSLKGIYYDHVTYSDNVHFQGVDGLSLNYTADLSYLGDSYEITFDVINDTSVDIEISDYMIHDDPYIDYQLSYHDGKEIHLGDIIKKGESKTLKYIVYYKNPILEDSYQFDSSFQISYEQLV